MSGSHLFSDCPLMVLGFVHGTQNWGRCVANLKRIPMGGNILDLNLDSFVLVDLRNEFDLKVKVG